MNPDSRRTRRMALVSGVCLAALPLSMLLGAGLGAYRIDPWRIPSVLFEGTGADYEVLMHVRLPRVVLGAVVGASLAVAGTTLQGLFRNPLAEPGLVGVTAGASLGAASCIVVFGSALSELGLLAIPVAAFLGAVLATLLVWRLARTGGQRVQPGILLLAGIAVNALAGAAVSLLTAVADDAQLRGIAFWMMGNLGGATWPVIGFTVTLVSCALPVLLKLARDLDVFALGEAEAWHLGVRTERLKALAVTATAVAVGASVAAAGGIGFIGLVVPHLLRMAGGAGHRFLLGASAVGGAAFLVLADMAARTAVAPVELPVGVITGLTGAPFLLWLLIRFKREVVHGPA